MKRAGIGLLVALVGSTVGTAEAGLWRDIYTGLEYFATPSGYPLFDSGDGTLVNGNRAGRLRIMPDRVGRGYTLELDRTFGTDSRGRAEVLDLGIYELELGGSTQATLGYTSRGMLIATGNFTVSQLNYSLRGKSGAQDFELSGTLNGTSTIEINPLGFYRINLSLNNSASELRVDGILVDDSTETDFSLGPIDIDGNIYVDALMAAMEVLGLDTTPLRELFPGSPIDRIMNPIQETLQSSGVVAGLQLEANGQLLPATELTLSADATNQVAGQNTPQMTPEPAAVLLLLGGMTTLWRCRRQ